MLIGMRLRQLREQKGLSQGDIEESTGLMRCYISRVENGHTVPSLETLERFAGALDVPLYRLFYAEEGAPPTSNPTPRKTLEEIADGDDAAATEARFLLKLKKLLEQIAESDREIILTLAKKLATRDSLVRRAS